MRQQLPPRPSVFDHHDLCEVFAKRLVTSEFKSLQLPFFHCIIFPHYCRLPNPTSITSTLCWHRHRSVTSLLTSSAESLMLAMTPETSIRSFLKISQHRCDSQWICKVCGDCCYSATASLQSIRSVHSSTHQSQVALLWSPPTEGKNPGCSADD